ncbi:hypothetical protein PILCRDRAFT_514726 [Piloderma croceum F 1598]|uniref:Uncharacterized protein n=1 Tax=Piloderma croceum (strain F 1598) TaxID=765440 RepID=A0A0C3FLY6_PILCF|nr:hypothetical protein PILCRDRAFT_514726 [Piloderma croceum F 1598]
MRSWSVFRRIRVGVFVSITIVSLVLTIVYSLFLSKDFRLYNKLQRAIVVTSAAINGITTVLMYLMLVVRYSIKLDAIRITVLLGIQAGNTALFTLHSPDLPCVAFKGGATCRQILSYTAIVSWVLCGLLVIYAACLAIMVCIPRPPPILGLDPELDAEVPVNAQARHIVHSSIDLHTGLVEPKAGKQSYAVWPSPDTRTRQYIQRQRGTPQRPPSAGYGSQFRPKVSPKHLLGRDGNAVYRPMGESWSIQASDESRPSPSSGLYTEPIPRARTQTLSSVYSVDTASSSVVFSGARSTTLPPPPPPAQFNPAQRPVAQITRPRSLSSSVYSATTGESMELPPPVPSIGVRQIAPGQQSIRSGKISDLDLGQWKRLVRDAAAGRRESSA